MITIDKISAVVRTWELILALMLMSLTWGHLNREFILVGIGAFNRNSAVVIAAVLSCITVLNALMWLLPLKPSFVHFPADLVLAIAWTRVSCQLGGWVAGACG
ncbi:hypothetical protein DL546_003254 [Coniochaeta pulveracea]|uniref:Uncharacterized protein n=1 Tax=Coniochaeta pulveracea TaxID=177199 RepID=A0A420Y999_9PEZI|nr:hypothetical protein DL546_003254 [Coniochaeta pulveracea]